MEYSIGHCADLAMELVSHLQCCIHHTFACPWIASEILVIEPGLINWTRHLDPDILIKTVRSLLLLKLTKLPIIKAKIFY